MKYLYLMLYLVPFSVLAKDPFEDFSEYGKLDESEIHQMHQGEFLYGDTELGFILTSGNTDSTTAKLKANIYQDFEDWRHQYKFDTLFKRDLNEATGKNETSAARLFFSSQSNYKLAQDDESFFVYGDYENDRFNGVSFKGTLVSGYGNRFIASRKDRIDFDIGPGLSAQKNTDNSAQNGFLIRAALQWERLISSRSRFNQAISYEKSLSGLSSRLKSETALVSRVNGALSVKFSYLYRYNSQPEAGKLSFDSETSAAFVFNF